MSNYEEKGDNDRESSNALGVAACPGVHHHKVKSQRSDAEGYAVLPKGRLLWPGSRRAATPCVFWTSLRLRPSMIEWQGKGKYS